MKDKDGNELVEWPYPGFGKQVAVGIVAGYAVVLAVVLLIVLLR